jgi:hypothetical protein
VDKLSYLLVMEVLAGGDGDGVVRGIFRCFRPFILEPIEEIGRERELPLATFGCHGG